jgi:hypothetical protein
MRSRQEIVREALAEWADRRERLLVQDAQLEQALAGRTPLQAAQAEVRRMEQRRGPRPKKKAPRRNAAGRFASAGTP